MSKDTLKHLIPPLYLVVWGVVSLYFATFHEAFSDETQSFLIAKNISFSEILSNICRTEGTPGLWYLILKLFIFIGLDYKSLYIASILPNFIGVCLFVYFSPFPKKVTYLLPLTYFIFYQYNIVARSYSLLLPCLIISAITYKKRSVHPYRYVLSLMVLGSITAYSFILACGLCFLFGVERLKQKQKIVPYWGLFGLFALLTAISLVPDIENLYLQDNIRSQKLLLVNMIYRVSQGFVTGYAVEEIGLYNALLGVSFFAFLLWYMIIEYPLPTAILFLPILILIVILPYHPWHSGILIYILIMIFWQYCPRHQIDKKYLNAAVLMFLLHQIMGTIFLFQMDKEYAYSGGKQTAEFIQKHKWNLNEIYTPTYSSLSVYGYETDAEISPWDWKQNGFIIREGIRKVEEYDKFVISAELYKIKPSYFDNLQYKNGYLCQRFSGGSFYPYDNTYFAETQYLYYRDVTNGK